jgi:hypothetical protein
VPLIITGSQRGIGRRPRPGIPHSNGIDRIEDADIVADLATFSYATPEVERALASADGLIHLATSADPDASDQVHLRSVVNAVRQVQARQRHKVPQLVKEVKAALGKWPARCPTVALSLSPGCPSAATRCG